MNKPDSIQILENVATPEECDFFTNKKIAQIASRDVYVKGMNRKILIPNEDIIDINLKFKIQKTAIDTIASVYKQEVKVDTSIYQLYETGTEKALHVDDYPVVLYSAFFYINDDYTGGEIHFPNLNFEYKPVKGSMIIFPNDALATPEPYESKHLHGVKKINSGVRASIATWFEKA